MPEKFTKVRTAEGGVLRLAKTDLSAGGTGPPGPPGASLRYATVVVAAADSLHPEDADVQCDGINDGAIISQIYADAEGPIRVLLMEGTFHLSDTEEGQIYIPSDYDGHVLEGQGPSTRLICDWSGPTASLAAILVASYYGQVLNLTMEGVEPDEVDWDDIFQYGSFIWLDQDFCNIRGCSFVGWCGNVATVLYYNHSTLTNCHFDLACLQAVWIDYYYCSVSGNTFNLHFHYEAEYDESCAIYKGEGDGCAIIGNTIDGYDAAAGIIVDNYYNAMVGNTIGGSFTTAAIWILGDENTVCSNNLADANADIKILDDGNDNDLCKTVRPATVVVAAADSLHPEQADFVCTGTDDHLVLQDACDQAYHATDNYRGRVLLMEGTFYVNDTVYLDYGVSLDGQDRSTIIDIESLPEGTAAFELSGENRINNIEFRNWGADGLTVLDSWSYDNMLTNCWFNIGTDDIAMTGDWDESIISDCWFSGGKIELQYFSDGSMSGMAGPFPPVVTIPYCHDSSFTGNNLSNISLDGSRYVVSGNRFDAFELYGYEATVTGNQGTVGDIYLSDSMVTSNRFADVTIDSTASAVLFAENDLRGYMLTDNGTGTLLEYPTTGDSNLY